ncbi:FecR family protein [Novosphingobium jiangmenense]|uniref:FecR domain-containing protein n=1 Tax=Novosphingobium jiangmenense TaxID=2791981 RepID=A0ABS0HJ01_9SPHN|nr:FecR domain-containing protein [Novosphingobium jiangmenense]MBF9152228.1 FecR domain-containing protein [Novosphingobium jiangmenense]
MPGKIRDEAAEWLARNENVGRSRAPGFETWLARDLRHRLAYAEVERAWRDSLALDQSPLGQERKLTRAPLHQQRSKQLAAVGACLLLGMGLLTLRFSGDNPVIGVGTTVEARTYTTAAGETRTWQLVDGSSLTLNGPSKARTNITRAIRQVTIDAGRVRIRVARRGTDAMQIMSAGTRVDSAAGTVDIARAANGLRVEVLDGHVQVQNADGARHTLGRGAHTIEARPSGTEHQSERSSSARPPMTTGDRISLGEAVSLLNARNAVQLRLASPALANRTLAGAIRLDDPEGFASILEALGGIRVTQRPGMLLIDMA